MFIDGKWTNAHNQETFASYNPANAELLGQVPSGGKEDALAAIDSASKAFPSWSSLTAYQRSKFLIDAHRLMMESQQEIAEIMTQEQGKPIRAAMNEVQYAADFLIWFAEEAKRVYGRTIPSSRSDQRFLVLNQPVGVVGAITPWNYPVSMITRKVAPALAAGCTIVVKPAEATPLCAKAVFQIFEKASFPPGVLNLVTAENPKPIGEIFINDARIRKITFTGSTKIGKMLAEGAGRGLKRISLELGGHAPFIVCADADPVHAAKGLSLVKFLNSGQACISPNRIYVHAQQEKAFLDELKSRVSKLKAGPGLEQDSKIGPLINQQALEKVETQVQDALKKGAELISGGERIRDDSCANGFFYAPTILSRVTPEMLIYREETFGPVAPVIIYQDEDDLLEMANDTHYGLASYVYTQNLKSAMRLFEGLEFGIVGINDINPTSAAAPFGGIKDSGIGREGASEGIHEYLETKLGGFSI